jgi:hypothetical protein
MSTPDPDKHEQDDFDIKNSKWVMSFTIVVLLILSYLMIGVWPAATEDLAVNATSSINSNMTFNAINAINTTRVVTLPATTFHIFIGPETLLLFIMMLSGAMGACIFSLWAVADHLGRRHDFFYKRWKAWYFTRPLIGAVLAFFFYLLIRGGLLTIGADVMALNLIVIAGLSGLVGMFSEQAILKLNELADATFTPKKADTNKP